MDFYTLSRRELQALCKRNKIPANITNVAMADALAALQSVEGIEEFLNGDRSGVPESPMKGEVISSEIPRTALRTSTRRKAVKDETITTRSRRGAAARDTEESENRDLNMALTTPSLPGSRRRTAAASSACKKVDFQMTVDDQKEDKDLDQEKKEIENTPAVPKSQKRVAGASTRKRTETKDSGAAEQRVYSTRRSVRLLEKNMESMSLGGDEKMEPITVHMSFDDMPNISEPVKENMELETESKKTDESVSKLDEDLSVEVDDGEKNEMGTEVKLSEEEPEIVLDDLLKSFDENVISAKSVDDSITEAPHANSDVKCFSEDEKVNEVSKDDDSVESSAEEINESDKSSLPTEDLDVTEVHKSSIAEEFGKEFESQQNESTCELDHKIEEDVEEEKHVNNSAEELSLPHENVEEETEVGDDVLSSDKESLEVKDDQDENDYKSDPTTGNEASDADIEGDKKETEMEKSSVQAEEDDTIINESMEEFPENASDDLVDVKIQWKVEEETLPKDITVEAIDSQPEIPNAIVQCEEALVEITTTSSNNNAVQSLATQFPRPTIEAKSPVKEQTISLLMDNPDVEEEEAEKEQNPKFVQFVVKNDTSLRQLKKLFKEKLQLNNKKMDNNNINTKVVGGGVKVRTALQPVPENRMTVDELEKRH
ncbi:probable serine/threonine-protein kinase kinX isoform X2 [Cucumis sativus]|uniref:probable serine/threonine-protein kinase kinX isoform X2 n=1 Tax=Cucumis sativus TaxID=3659 RepID=UPI0012F4A799|nr:probable serine/threonine-protein kinase kinX isoform X2 [Cucumis sativus]KAE8647937.1 hypothetical protein Csa_000497 [Cucumis sativus]